MTMFICTANRYAAGVLTAALIAAGGCKPSPSASTIPTSPQGDSSLPRPPAAGDFQAFIQTLLPSMLRVTEIKMDPPSRLPDAGLGHNIWLLNSKISLAPTEDLYSLPLPKDTEAIDNLASELNALIGWRNAYVRSPYAACGAFEVEVPAPLPQLIVATATKDHPLTPIYLKVNAEWRVDHWQFEPAEGGTLPADPGKTRGEFGGATMVQGSPEAAGAISGLRDAVAQARKDIEAIHSRYAEQVAGATKAGTAYSGTVSYAAKVTPCELQFLDAPPGGDARFASFRITLPGNPPCWYVYQARLTTELPIPVPGTEASNSASGFGTSNQVPDHNLFPHRTSTSNNKVARDSVADWLSSNEHGGQKLLVLGKNITGTINDFGAAPGIQLSVQRKP